MRRLVAFVFAALTLVSTGSASAADPKEPVRSKFYIFGDMDVFGTDRGPGLNLFSQRRAAEFGRLMNLKKDFIPAISRTNRDPVFK